MRQTTKRKRARKKNTKRKKRKKKKKGKKKKREEEQRGSRSSAPRTPAAARRRPRGNGRLDNPIRFTQRIQKLKKSLKRNFANRRAALSSPRQTSDLNAPRVRKVENPGVWQGESGLIRARLGHSRAGQGA